MAARAVPATPAASLPPAPGAVGANQFRTERGNVVAARTVWQSMGGRGRTSVLGRLVPVSRDAADQPQASIFVGGPTTFEVPVWWRSTSATNVVVEVDGAPVVNLPCLSGRGGSHLRCYIDGGDSPEADRARSAVEAGRSARLIFLNGGAPVSELTFDLSGLRGRS
ncbi:MAG: hypothetical protein JNL66_02165 [Alphaproteobacteria bacterium]|nr:hypothetical protein [Alphaproteobacteria bacterium]